MLEIDTLTIIACCIVLFCTISACIFNPFFKRVRTNLTESENFEDEEIAQLPRQSLPIYYRENGAVYILKTTHLFSGVNLYKEKCYAYIMEQAHSVDIDTEFDFLIAETIMKASS